MNSENGSLSAQGECSCCSLVGVFSKRGDLGTRLVLVVAKESPGYREPLANQLKQRTEIAETFVLSDVFCDK